MKIYNYRSLYLFTPTEIIMLMKTQKAFLPILSILVSILYYLLNNLSNVDIIPSLTVLQDKNLPNPMHIKGLARFSFYIKNAYFFSILTIVKFFSSFFRLEFDNHF